MLSRVLRVAIAAAVVTAVAVPAQASTREDGVSLAGKKVVLVNDDGVQAAKANGSDGRGIYVLRQALCQAGADVAIVGPWSQQSGKSRAVSGAPFVAVAPPLVVPAEFAADCANAPGHGLVLGACQSTAPCAADSPSVTPADSVDIALTGVLPQRLGWTNGPDLVVSGINSGPNTDIAVNGSGTIGAATVAVERGVPAVAVSAGTQVSPPPSNDTYKAAADVVVRLLASPRTWTFVQDMALVNVNQPDVQPGAGPSPVRWTSVGRVVQGRIAYTPTGDGTYQVGYNAVTPPPVLEPGSDTKALLDGFVSVSAVDVNRTFTGSLTRHR